MENNSYQQMGKKKEIIQRLFTNGYITIDEMWILLNDNQGVKYYPMGNILDPYKQQLPYSQEIQEIYNKIPKNEI